MTLEELKALPKIELHCHLDGSLSREFLESRLGRKVEPSEIHVSDDCQSLQEYLEKFDLPGQCLQDEKGLELAGYFFLSPCKSVTYNIFISLSTPFNTAFLPNHS